MKFPILIYYIRKYKNEDKKYHYTVLKQKKILRIQDSFLFFLLLTYFVDLFLLFDFDCYVDVSLSKGFEEDILLLEYM